LASQVFFWNLGGSLFDPITSAFLHQFKTITNRLQQPTASESSNWAPLDHGCRGLWVPGQLNIGDEIYKQFPRCSCTSRMPWVSILEAKSFKRVYPFPSLSLWWLSYHLFLRCPQGISLLSWFEELGFFLMAWMFLTTIPYMAATINESRFRQKYEFLKSFNSVFCSPLSL
jgi:hypothetical protein